jgi:hypothetical protein
VNAASCSNGSWQQGAQRHELTAEKLGNIKFFPISLNLKLAHVPSVELVSRNIVFGLEMLGPATGCFALGPTRTIGSAVDDAVEGTAGASADSATGGSAGVEAFGTFFFSILSRGFGLMEVYFGVHIGGSMISISSSFSASSFIFCCCRVSRIDLRSALGRPG